MSKETDRRAAPSSSKRGWLTMLVIVVIAAAIAGGGYYLSKNAASTQTGGGRSGGRGGPGGSPGAAGGRGGGMPMPVGVATVSRGDIHIILNALGTVVPLRDVTVSAQVAGQLQSVAFKEGQTVRAGDLLAQIDPRPYQAALTQAQGSLARDQALLAEAKIDLARYQTLFKEDSIAKQQLDTQQSLVHQYEGAIQADQGSVAVARVNLDYTRITAPVAGSVGLRQVDPGNNVGSGSSIVVLTQIQPIDVLFTLPEDNLPAVVAKNHAGTILAADVYDRAGTTRLASGSLASLDNQIDTSTGTVKAKAEFANEDESLFPNQFVNVKLMLDVMHDATIIPTSALERGSSGLFVYVVQSDKTVTVRNIKTGPTEGEQVAVSDGLQAGEVVVTSGADRLREGSKVELPGDAPKIPSEASSGDASGAGQGHGNWQGHAHGQWKGHGHGQHHHSGSQDSGSGDAGQGGPPASSSPGNGGGGA